MGVNAYPLPIILLFAKANALVLRTRDFAWQATLQVCVANFGILLFAKANAHCPLANGIGRAPEALRSNGVPWARNPGKPGFLRSKKWPRKLTQKNRQRRVFRGAQYFVC